jgi:hypothetical protein
MRKNTSTALHHTKQQNHAAHEHQLVLLVYVILGRNMLKQIKGCFSESVVIYTAASLHTGVLRA